VKACVMVRQHNSTAAIAERKPNRQKSNSRVCSQGFLFSLHQRLLVRTLWYVREYESIKNTFQQVNIFLPISCSVFPGAYARTHTHTHTHTETYITSAGSDN
jgi:hypothetical protein